MPFGLLSRTPQAKHAYIPPHIQAEMDQFMQRAPLSLQRQMQGGTAMSGQAEQAMTQYMKKMMPAHMQEYVTPYAYQQASAPRQNLPTHDIQPRAPAPSPMRRDHSLGFGQQYVVQVDTPLTLSSPSTLAFTPQYNPSAQQGGAPEPRQPSPPPYPTDNSTGTPAAQSGAYDFILSHGQQPKYNSLGGLGSSSKTRLALVGGGVIALLLIMWAVFSILGSGGTTPSQQLLGVAQRQAELARISQTPQQQAANPGTQNFALTAQLTLETDQQAILRYLAQYGVKPSGNELAALQSSTTDTQLQNAQNSGTYDQTYLGIAQSELARYQQALQQAFASSAPTATHERSLLQAAYAHAQLLVALSKQQ